MVTGGAVRIGAEIVRGFADLGHPVIIHCRRSRGSAEALAEGIVARGGRAHVLAADLASPNEVERLVPRALALEPNLGILINNASVFAGDQPDLPDASGWGEALMTNAYAPARLAADLHRAVAGGVVVAILDQKLANPNPDYFSYTASKAALHEVVRMQAMAFAPRTRLFAVSPGLTLPSGDQTVEEHAASAVMNLLRRQTSPADVVAAVLFAASGTLQSGEVVLVDGGQHLTPQSRDVMFLVRGQS
jgi:NAD(P)-dependent dehydrogenase (short-subunit alcohol dehydrogenase family)